MEINSKVASSYRAFLSAFPSAMRGPKAQWGPWLPKLEETHGVAQLLNAAPQKARQALSPTALPLFCCCFFMYFFLYSPTSFAAQSLSPQGSVGRRNVLMSPVSSARESLCLKFWGTSTCLPARSRCAQAGGSLNGPSRRLPAPTHADVPISFGSRAQRGQKDF